MGLGDWLMATADAREAHNKHGVRIAFGNGKKRYWSEVFERNPIIPKDLEPGERFAWVANYPMNRPYIVETTEKRYIFREDFKAVPGELYPKNPQSGGYVMIEPNVKTDLWIGKNKDWGLKNWVALSKKIDADLLQCGAPNKTKLKRARFRETKTFMEAVDYLAGARLLITTDGALHHAAAALGVPSVVLWGGMASPKNLGYDAHTNIWHGDEPCGTHSASCDHCKRAMSKITVEQVLEECKRYLAT